MGRSESPISADAAAIAAATLTQVALGLTPRDGETERVVRAEAMRVWAAFYDDLRHGNFERIER